MITVGSSGERGPSSVLTTQGDCFAQTEIRYIFPSREMTSWSWPWIASCEVNGQIFAVRANEIMVMSQPRPIRSVQMSEGWT